MLILPFMAISCLIYYVHLDLVIPYGDDAADAALVPVSQVTDLGFVSFNHAFQQFIANRGVMQEGGFFRHAVKRPFS